MNNSDIGCPLEQCPNIDIQHGHQGAKWRVKNYMIVSSGISFYNFFLNVGCLSYCRGTDRCNAFRSNRNILKVEKDDGSSSDFCCKIICLC